MAKKVIKINESDLSRIITETVKKVLNEQWGGSSAPGYSYDYRNNQVQSNQGGAFGGSSLDQAHDSSQAYKQQQARQQQGTSEYEKCQQWCANHMEDIYSMCPGLANSPIQAYQFLKNKGF